MVIKYKIMRRSKNIWTLSANYLSREMNEADSKNFEKLLEQNPTLASEFEKIRLSWDALDLKKPADPQKSWNKLYNRIKQDHLNIEQRMQIRSFKFYFLRIAALLVLAVMIGFTAKLILSESRQGNRDFNLFEAPSSVSSFTFPDGSRVFLNKGSKLFYGEDFAENRNVTLEGEGFFEVLSDPSNPFKIQTSNAIISVIGTSFNVRENLNEKSTEVLVESGIVNLKKDENSEGLLLSQGKFGKSNNKRVVSIVNNDPNYLSWKTRDFIFIDQDLSSVLEILQKSYHIKIKTEEPGINNLKLTSSYSQQSIDAILNTICKAFNMECKKENNSYTLKMK